MYAKQILTPTILSLGLALSVACGSGGDDGPGTIDDPPPDCPSGNCGKDSFRSAVPTKKSALIQFGNTSARIAPDEQANGDVGSTSFHLEATSPVMLELADHIAEINGFIEDVFDDLEDVAGTTPEEESDAVHVWRAPDPDEPSLDRVLMLSTTDEVNFELSYFLGQNGFDPSTGTEVMTGTMTLDGEEKERFELVIDLDAVTQVVPSLGLSGAVRISAMPFSGGAREVWYDFDEVAAAGEAPESSLTTYWIFDEGDGALEYLAAVEDEMATVFARWDDGGGRLDQHVEYDHEELGLVDFIMTNCWDAGGGEVFDGFAFIDQDLSYYGELDGEEADCEFGPVEGHPNPGEDFDNLPGDDEWDALELQSIEVGEDPLCYDDPADPDCIPFCEDEPADPDCVDYCDVIDDPEFCE